MNEIKKNLLAIVAEGICAAVKDVQGKEHWFNIDDAVTHIEEVITSKIENYRERVLKVLHDNRRVPDYPDDDNGISKWLVENLRAQVVGEIIQIIYKVPTEETK